MTRLLLLSALLLALLAPASPAGTLGLQLSLTTEVSRFEVPAEATTLTAAQRQHAAYLQRGSFVVAVALANHSRDDVRLTYADAASAHARFKFSLRDASGTVLWESHPAEDDPDFGL